MDSNEEVVYLVAIRTAKRNGSESVQAAMKAFDESGLFQQPPVGTSFHHAAAWARPCRELTANDHHHLRELGLDFENANQIAPVAWESGE